MHASLDVSTVTILASVTTGVDFLTWFLVLTVVLWVVAGVLAAANRGQLSRDPPLIGCCELKVPLTHHAFR